MDFVDLIKEVCADMGSNLESHLIPVPCHVGAITYVGFKVDGEDDLAKVISEFFYLAVQKSPIKDVTDFVTRTRVALSYPRRVGDIVEFPCLYWDQA